MVLFCPVTLISDYIFNGTNNSMYVKYNLNVSKKESGYHFKIMAGRSGKTVHSGSSL